LLDAADGAGLGQIGNAGVDGLVDPPLVDRAAYLALVFLIERGYVERLVDAAAVDRFVGVGASRRRRRSADRAVNRPLVDRAGLLRSRLSGKRTGIESLADQTAGDRFVGIVVRRRGWKRAGIERLVDPPTRDRLHRTGWIVWRRGGAGQRPPAF
jgi:hypothetical protein